MTYEQLFEMIDAARLTAENAARRLGVSHMTLHRWRSRPKHRRLAPVYERAFQATALELMNDGVLPVDSAIAQTLMARPNLAGFHAALRNLGASTESSDGGKGDPDAILTSLVQIGTRAECRERVDRQTARISTFRGRSREWEETIARTLTVIRSPELTTVDKTVAYGGLFYLLTPFDLIPDMIAGFGLLDDFAILGMVIAFYARRFPTLFTSTPA